MAVCRGPGGKNGGVQVRKAPEPPFINCKHSARDKRASSRERVSIPRGTSQL
eukprot:COSAG03_NODE_23371_length_280_cov_1.149171_1_plen_51_part_01